MQHTREQWEFLIRKNLTPQELEIYIERRYPLSSKNTLADNDQLLANNIKLYGEIVNKRQAPNQSCALI